MYLLRRIAKAQQGKVWEVASLMSKVCGAYEENGRKQLNAIPKTELGLAQFIAQNGNRDPA